MPENKHHVAWADRLGLNKIWHEAIGYCRICYGTEDYRKAVFGFYHLIVDIKDGPNLKILINTYIQDVWEPKIKAETDAWVEHNQDYKDEIQVIQDENEKIRDDHMIDLFDYMLQLLENQGFGFYKSDIIDEDYSDQESIDDDEE
jgi:hypothetical protein